MTFWAESSTRSPAEEIYSSAAMSMVRAVTPSRDAFSSYSSSGAVVVSNRPAKATVSSDAVVVFSMFSMFFPHVSLVLDFFVLIHLYERFGVHSVYVSFLLLGLYYTPS